MIYLFDNFIVRICVLICEVKLLQLRRSFHEVSRDKKIIKAEACAVIDFETGGTVLSIELNIKFPAGSVAVK